MTDGNGLPLAAEISAGQRHETLYAGPVLEAARWRSCNLATVKLAIPQRYLQKWAPHDSADRR
jgi:hypothetical protein